MLGRPGMLGAGQEQRDGRGVIDRVGVHRVDEADVVGDRAGVRQEVAQPASRSGHRCQRAMPGRTSCR